MKVATPRLKRQQGVAIILAIMITALAAALASSLVLRVQQWIDRVDLIQSYVQARELARSGLDYGIAILQDDLLNSAVDHLGEDWARQLPPFEGEGGVLSGRIVDLQGKLNLNNLYVRGRINQKYLNVYRRLLQINQLPVNLADTLADWIDSDDEQRPGGAESAYYNSQSPPYLPDNGPLTSLTGLSRVKGYNGEIIQKLSAWVTVFPVKVTADQGAGAGQAGDSAQRDDESVIANQPLLNVNTAPAEVLAAAVQGLSLSDAQTMVRQRKDAYYRNLGDFTSRIPSKSYTIEIPLDVRSQYFEVRSAAQFGEAQVRMRALVSRLANANRGWASIVSLQWE